MRVRPLLCALLVSLAAAACESGNASTALPRLTEARAERDLSQDGAALLTTTVTVRFDQSYELAPAKVPLASFFELDVPTIKQTTDRVFAQTAEFQDKDDRRVVKLGVNRLVPEGTKLKVSRSAFSSGATGDLEVDVQSDLTPTAAVLASASLAIPGPDFLAAAVDPEPRPEDRDTAAQRLALQAHLEQRGAPAVVRDAALARYDQMPADLIPAPKIRAALAALTGTFAEPAIDALLTNKNCTGAPVALIAFQPPPGFPELLARVTFSNKRRIISLNPVLEADRIEHIMPLLAHETIHCDLEDSRTEEVAATAFDTFLYTQLIASDPTLVETGTKATRELNIDAVAFINSGRRFPESVGILPSSGVTRAVPNTNSTYSSFAELVAAAYPNVDTATSSPEAVADAYIARLAQVAGIPPQSGFNLKYLDELLGRAMDPKALAQAILALGLVPVQ